MKFEDQRKIMIQEQIIDRGISDSKIIDALNSVPREMFVPVQYRDFSYNDGPLRIGENQTISQPFIVSQMTSLLEIDSSDSILEIGTGSGYQTAILAEMGATVYTVERFSSLSKSAEKILKSLKYKNIYFHIGDGSEGWKNAYPPMKKFDKIIITAAAPQIPQSLINQMSDNSKLIAPVGELDIQTLVLLTKKDGEIETQSFDECTFVPLIGSEGWKL